MTSGVTQALLQIAVPKAGADGKGLRNGAPAGDFVEALGLGAPSKSAKQVDANATDVEPRDAPVRNMWPRLAPKFDDGVKDVRERTQLPEIATPLSDNAGDDDGDARIGVLLDDQPEDGTADKPTVVTTEKAFPEAPSPTPTREVATAGDAPPPGIERDPAAAPVPAQSALAVPAAVKTAILTVLPPAVAGDPSPKAARVVGAPEIVLDGDQPSPRAAGSAGDRPAPSSFTPIGNRDQVEPSSFEPALRKSAAAERSAPAVRPKDEPPQASVEPAKASPRVTVLAQQSIPAPAPSTALLLTDSISASGLLGASATRGSADAIHASVTHSSAQSLKIQLHPAELGMVTATLRFAGEQLSIELQVENQEAYRRLSSDSDTILGALRDLGYEVDRVTVIQPPIASTPATRADNSAFMPSPQDRGGDQFASGMANGGGDGSGDHPSQQGGNPGQGDQRNAPPRPENSSGGIYI